MAESAMPFLSAEWMTAAGDWAEVPSLGKAILASAAAAPSAGAGIPGSRGSTTPAQGRVRQLLGPPLPGGEGERIANITGGHRRRLERG